MGRYVLREYPPDWNLHAMASDYIAEEIEKIADMVGKTSHVRGDIQLFRFGKCTAHAGIITRWPVFVHCHKQAGHVQPGVLQNSEWSARTVSAWRLNVEKLGVFT